MTSGIDKIPHLLEVVGLAVGFVLLFLISDAL